MSDNSEAVDDNADNAEVAASDNPLSPENIGIVQFIILARIYDVMMLQLQLSHPEEASELVKLHTEGKLIGAPPDFTGEFLSE